MRPRGVIALITVIILGALILAVGLSASFTGQTETILAGALDREQLARMFAQTCADEALYRLKLDSTYTGGTVPVGASDTCTVSVSGSGSSRTITLAATSDIFTKTIVIAASLKQNAAANASAWHIDSWTEGDPP